MYKHNHTQAQMNDLCNEGKEFSTEYHYARREWLLPENQDKRVSLNYLAKFSNTCKKKLTGGKQTAFTISGLPSLMLGSTRSYGEKEAMDKEKGLRIKKNRITTSLGHNPARLGSFWSAHVLALYNLMFELLQNFCVSF